MRPSVFLIGLAAAVSALPQHPVAAPGSVNIDADAFEVDASPVGLDAGADADAAADIDDGTVGLAQDGPYRQGGHANKNSMTFTGEQSAPGLAPFTFTRDKAYKAKWKKLGEYRKRPFDEFYEAAKKKQTPREKCKERCKAITGIWPFTMWCKLCKAIYTE